MVVHEHSNLEIVSSLSKPLGVGISAVEMVTRFVKFKLAGFCGFGSLGEERRNLRRVHGLKAPGRAKSLLQNG